MARIEHRPVAFADEFAARFRADDAHAAGDQNAHVVLLHLVIVRESGRSSNHLAIGVYWIIRFRG
jgi:hypothetical protein